MISRDLTKAIEHLNSGHIVAIPTETVYGLAARIDHPEAVRHIFTTKERPFFDPLIVHVSSLVQAQQLTKEWNVCLQKLAETFWPGPLTLLIKKNDQKVSDVITSGLERVGLRWPSHSLAQQVIAQTGPLAAPSANKFGKTSPTQAEHVESEFRKENIFILDGGPCDVGIESTVLLVNDLNGIFELSILRPGHIKKTDLEKSLQNLNYRFVETVEKSQAPGQMKHHYMPQVPLIIFERLQMSDVDLLEHIQKQLLTLPDEVEQVKIIKPQGEIEKVQELILSKDPRQAARELYSKLREVSQAQPDIIIFKKRSYHQDESWLAVFERLEKAASLIVS